MEEATQPKKKNSFFENVVIWAIWLFVGFIIYINAVELLKDDNILWRIFGAFVLVGLLLLAGAMLHIKPFQWGWHYFLKMIGAILKPIIKVLNEIIPAVENGLTALFKGLFSGISIMFVIAILLIILVVAFAIVKWAFNYVF